MAAALKILALFALVTLTSATTGFDAIQAISQGTFTCLKQNGYHFYVARVWESIGKVDETGVANIKHAKAGKNYNIWIVSLAGWQYVDGYIFPCHKAGCAGPAQQIETVVNRLRAEGANFGMLWLDIEIQDWPADHNTNRNFITAMANQLHVSLREKAAREISKAMGINYGIYSNNHNWENIVGLDWTGVSSRPLWWANYNGLQSFEHFVPFGGWSKPAIHQYKGTTAGPCGVSMDLNWYP